MSAKLYKYICSIVLILQNYCLSLGQNQNSVPWNQYAPTPKALEMTRYGHMPPDLNSGTYSCDIPIYTYEDKYLHIPVSLHYSSSGFQPAKMSDEAGLHWTLMAGGAITREIVGVDDFDLDNGLIDTGFQVEDSTYYKIIHSNQQPFFYYSSPNNCPQLQGSSHEYSSDRYHFTMPGHSGSFVMNHSGDGFQVYGTERGRGLYDIVYDSAKKSFTIHTGDGYSYRFGYPDGAGYLTIKTRELNWSREAVVGNGDDDPANNLQDNELHIVTWLLDKITAPDGSTVSFTYNSNRLQQGIPQPETDVVTSFTREHYTRTIDNNNYNCYKKASLTYTSYLTQISIDTPLSSGDILTINFDWIRDTTCELTGNNDRKYTPLVMPRRHLNNIQVKKGNTVLRQADLTYHPDCNRHLLKTVAISGQGCYQMDYWLNDTNHPSLPGILSNAIDFWGYYNGRTVTDQQINPMEQDTYQDEYIRWSYRNPDWSFARQGTLKRITYPTGGYTDIEYEPNSAEQILLRRFTLSGSSGIEPADPINDPDVDLKHYLPSLFPVSVMDTTYTHDCGGVRVKIVTDHAGADSLAYTYHYSGGIIQQFPRFFSGELFGASLYDPDLPFPGSSFDQRHIAYTTVTQVNPDSSYVVTTFSDWEDCPDEYSFHREEYQTVATPLSLNQIMDDNIFRQPDSRAYRRGLPVSKEYYDNTGKKVCEETWEYTDLGDGYRAYALYGGHYVWTARTFLCDRKPSRFTRSEWLDGSDPFLLDTLKEHTEYGYNINGQLSRTTRSSNGFTEEQRTYYPDDISGGIYPLMSSSDFKDKPVEEVVIRNGKVVQAKLTTYGNFPNQYLPTKTYRAEVGEGIPLADFNPFGGVNTGSHYSLDGEVTSYNSHGNPLHSIDRDGVPTTYQWDPCGDKLAAIFVGSVKGLSSWYEREMFSYTESDENLVGLGIEKAFTSDVAGSFNFTFTPSDTTLTLSATLDGSSLNLRKMADGSVKLRSSKMILPGEHLLRITGRPSSPPFYNVLLMGSLTISFPRYTAVSHEQLAQDCFFEDFESEGGDLSPNFNSSRGCRSNYSRSVNVIAGRPYVLDYMRRVNNQWQYVRETVTPSNSSYTISISASFGSPIDHVRFYPADNTVMSFTWKPTGELRCKVDGSGRVETYEYDILGRLTAVKDGEGNLVKEYDYHYKTENNE